MDRFGRMERRASRLAGIAYRIAILTLLVKIVVGIALLVAVYHFVSAPAQVAGDVGAWLGGIAAAFIEGWRNG